MCIDVSGFTNLLKEYGSSQSYAELLIEEFRTYFKEMVATIECSQRKPAIVNAVAKKPSPINLPNTLDDTIPKDSLKSLTTAFETYFKASHNTEDISPATSDAISKLCSEINNIVDNKETTPSVSSDVVNLSVSYEPGDIIKFTGDGLQVVWPCHVYNERISKESIGDAALENAMIEAVKNAALCGETLLRNLSERTIKIRSTQESHLNIRVGISCGEMLGIDCVEEDNESQRLKRAEFFILGQPLVDGNTAESLGKQLHASNRLIISDSAMRYLSMEKYHPIHNNKNFYIGTLQHHGKDHKSEAKTMIDFCRKKRNRLLGQRIESCSYTFKTLIEQHSHESIRESKKEPAESTAPENKLTADIKLPSSPIMNEHLSKVGKVHPKMFSVEHFGAEKNAMSLCKDGAVNKTTYYSSASVATTITTTATATEAAIDETVNGTDKNPADCSEPPSSKKPGGAIGKVVTLFISLSMDDNELFVDKAAVRKFNEYGLVSTLSDQELYQDETLTQKYTKYLSIICDVIHDHEGHLRQFINDDKGVVAICNFGIKNFSTAYSSDTNLCEFGSDKQTPTQGRSNKLFKSIATNSSVFGSGNKSFSSNTAASPAPNSSMSQDSASKVFPLNAAPPTPNSIAYDSGSKAFPWGGASPALNRFSQDSGSKVSPLNGEPPTPNSFCYDSGREESRLFSEEQTKVKITEHSSHVSKAILSAWLIRNKLQAVGVTTKMGLSRGIAYYGFLGTSQRREYVVMGGSVNTSARLMGKANPGEILCDWTCFNNLLIQDSKVRKRARENDDEERPLLLYDLHKEKRIEIKSPNHDMIFPCRVKSFYDIKGYENKEIKAAIISSCQK